jgi:hypothetical protein
LDQLPNRGALFSGNPADHFLQSRQIALLAEVLGAHLGQRALFRAPSF